MFTNKAPSGSLAAVRGLGRRSLFSLAMAAALPLTSPALAAPTQAPAEATAIITQFNAALIAAMKAGGQTGFNSRFETLAPAIDQAFDLPSVLAVSVGPGWGSLAPDQQTRLLLAFRRYTVASYVASFDNYSGQSFSVLPQTRSLEAGRVVVQSRIKPATGDAIEMDYVMQQTPLGWKIVDVLAAGSISRVAVQRSDFRHLLSRGGGDALLSSLQRKTSDLSGGVLA
jgi:phospholipid transport system substrate-binding protein